MQGHKHLEVGVQATHSVRSYGKMPYVCIFI